MNPPRVAIGVLVLLTVATCGCSPPAPKAPAAGAAGTSTQPAGAVKAPAASQAQSDLGFLHFAFSGMVPPGEASPRLPKDLDTAANSIKVVDERIFERTKNGEYVVRWGEPMNSPVLAYEKNAPTAGGWVLRGTGQVEKMAAADLQKLLASATGS
jgi:hypothetical protein